MALTAKLSFAHRADRRAHSRRTVKLAVGSETASGPQPAVVHDISRTGLLLESKARIEAGEIIAVHLLGETRPAEVIWRSGRFHGCTFQVPLSSGAVSAAALRSPFVGTLAGDPPKRLQTAHKVQVIALASVVLWGLLLGLAAWILA